MLRNHKKGGESLFEEEIIRGVRGQANRFEPIYK